MAVIAEASKYTKNGSSKLEESLGESLRAHGGGSSEPGLAHEGTEGSPSSSPSTSLDFLFAEPSVKAKILSLLA